MQGVLFIKFSLYFRQFPQNRMPCWSLFIKSSVKGKAQCACKNIFFRFKKIFDKYVRVHSDNIEFEDRSRYLSVVRICFSAKIFISLFGIYILFLSFKNYHLSTYTQLPYWLRVYSHRVTAIAIATSLEMGNIVLYGTIHI